MNIESIAEELGLDRTTVKGEELRARCPFHDDNKPSFYLNTDSGLWFCQSKCGGGNLESLVRRVFDISRKEAKAWLKERDYAAGVSDKPHALATARKRRKAKQEPRKPCPPFDIKHIPSWMTARGFSLKILKRYQCGTSYFYDALVIPVLQSRAYIYRRAPGREPKYKYTEGFKSHSTLYGLHDVKPVEDTIILVEGPLDCLWLRQYGYQNSLAIMGGATLGMEQRRIVKEDLEPKKVILAYDNDDAGRALTDKTVVALSKLECYTVNWDGVEWPDDSDDDLTFVPDDVAEMPEDRLKALLEDVVLVPVDEAKERIAARKGTKTP